MQLFLTLQSAILAPFAALASPFELPFPFQATGQEHTTSDRTSPAFDLVFPLVVVVFSVYGVTLLHPSLTSKRQVSIHTSRASLRQMLLRLRPLSLYRPPCPSPVFGLGTGYLLIIFSLTSYVSYRRVVRAGSPVFPGSYHGGILDPGT